MAESAKRVQADRICAGVAVFWFDEKKRLAVAKEFQKKRIRFLQTVWDKDNELADEGFLPMML